MRIAVFSDIHSNLPALEAVLKDIDRQGTDAVYCLGDLVGYAAFPNEVTDRIRREQISTIMGNYDDGVGFDRDECGCAYREADERLRGQQSLEWTKARVTPDTMRVAFSHRRGDVSSWLTPFAEVSMNRVAVAVPASRQATSHKRMGVFERYLSL